MALTKELVRDVASYLVSQGICQAIGTDIFLDYRPDSPDSLVVIHEYQGDPPTFGVDALQRRIQILVRDISEMTCKEKIWQIFQLLNIPEQPIIQMGVRWAVSGALQPPFKTEIDIKQRPVYVFNVSMTTYADS